MSNPILLATYQEIFQQPEVWKKTFRFILEKKNEIHDFFLKNTDDKTEYIFTGAGTSAFIGNTLSFLYPRKNIYNCKSVSTTDITTHSEQIFERKKRYLLFSFARSGNSPESLAAFAAANEICKENVSHVILTCNPTGKLAQQARGKNSLLLILPPETNDKGLAMTSSYSSMLLSAMLIADIENVDSKQGQIKIFCEKGNELLTNFSEDLQKISQLDYNRAVFLGSGELKGVAEECHLKLQELTDGNVMCTFDSFLGFRHGPKAVLNDKTLIVYLFSDNAHTLNYEMDLAKQIYFQENPISQLYISSQKTNIKGVEFDVEIVPANAEKTDFDIILYVFVGQLLGLYKSLDLGLNPDNPSVSGKISRVVEGVKIYHKNYI